MAFFGNMPGTVKITGLVHQKAYFTLLFYCLFSISLAFPASPATEPRPFNLSGLEWPGNLQSHETPILETRGSSWKPDYVLHVTEEGIRKACMASWETRMSKVFNGDTPGPLLRFTEEETKWVRVYNHMEDHEFAVHWHGLDVEPWNDGTLETQRPIYPKYFRDYRITPRAGSAGTYMYHDHAGSFGALTATGPMIVDEANRKPAYPYDEDRVIFVGDWYNEVDEYYDGDLKTDGFFNFVGASNSILLNGMAYGVDYPDGEEERNPPRHPKTCDYPVIKVQPGKTYRFRFIGGTVVSHIAFQIQGHKFQVIEADGEDTRSPTLDTLTLGSGQRHSILLPTWSKEDLEKLKKTRNMNGVWLEGREINRMDTEKRPPVLAYILYDDTEDNKAPAEIPEDRLFRLDLHGNRVQTQPDVYTSTFSGLAFPSDIDEDMKLAPFHRYTDLPSNREVTKTIKIGSRELFPDGRMKWSMNGVSYEGRPDGVPRYEAILREDQAHCPSPEAYNLQTPYDSQQHVYTFKKGDVIDIILENWSADDEWTTAASDTHPMHLHGAHFFDLGYGLGEWSPKAKYNGYPLKRDTSMLYSSGCEGGDGKGEGEYYSSGWRHIRFKVESLGVWMLHCHTLGHMLSGMATNFAFGTPDEIRDLPKPDVVGWDADKPQNLYSKLDTHARPHDECPVGKTYEQVKNWGER
ncbi:hypothetical protein N7492_003468 [Penicillium capsulatum]|uniref:Multicopper oxidase n=1 Tax=Penicillium capsulatum TaxID=69766 RepID=A0A9W9ILE1_9EURO|nr:hypothetical protein N7492_003468 [Penicillium capsulatum]KAJ6121949.1 hypothetical protein N7512_004414 [Penicillium capsulatum]